MKILFALAGLHRVDRGAEIAFIAIASELARMGEEITLIGSGPSRPGQPYRYIQAGALGRKRFEKFPKFPVFRNETAWEEASFVPGLLRAYKPADYDVTLACSYPFTHWVLRRPVSGGKRPAHVFVTQNGDWPAYADNAEYRFFDCDGLVCINPDYYDRNKDRYHSALIPNGVDVGRFKPGPANPQRFGLLPTQPIILMVSALIPSKNVADGIRAVSRIPEAMLVVAGDGPLNAEMQALADELLPGRYLRLTAAAADMPDLYRSADCFLHLSRDESFGNVFVEAMACGTPTVAWDLSRTRWIVGDDAFLADPADKDSLVTQLRSAMDVRGGLTDWLVERAANFAWPKIAASYRDFLEEVVSRSGHERR